MITKFIPFLLLCTFLTACEDIAIVHDLQERDANEILVVLYKHGIRASKEKTEKNQEVTWGIKVKPADEQIARDILVANNLPKIRQMGLEGICKDAGLILTPKTEKCREILAFKGEIINSLESIPGVVSADVVLNIPDKEDFPDENSPMPRPTAAVTIQYLNDSLNDSRLTEGKVQEFVSNSVSELDPRDVAVIISYMITTPGKKPAEAVPSVSAEVLAKDVVAAVSADETLQPEADLVSIGGLKMNRESAKKFKVIAALFLVLFMVLAVAFIFVLLRMARMRTKSSLVAKADDAAEQKLLEA